MKERNNIFFNKKPFYSLSIRFDKYLSVSDISDFIGRMGANPKLGSAIFVYKHIGREAVDVRDYIFPDQSKHLISYDNRNLYPRSYCRSLIDLEDSIENFLEERFPSKPIIKRSRLDKFIKVNKIKHILDNYIFPYGRYNAMDKHDLYFWEEVNISCFDEPAYGELFMGSQTILILSENPALENIPEGTLLDQGTGPEDSSSRVDDRLRKEFFPSEYADVPYQVYSKIIDHTIFEKINYENFHKLYGLSEIEGEDIVSRDEVDFVYACFVERLTEEIIQ